MSPAWFFSIRRRRWFRYARYYLYTWNCEPVHLWNTVTAEQSNCFSKAYTARKQEAKSLVSTYGCSGKQLNKVWLWPNSFDFEGNGGSEVELVSEGGRSFESQLNPFYFLGWVNWLPWYQFQPLCFCSFKRVIFHIDYMKSRILTWTCQHLELKLIVGNLGAEALKTSLNQSHIYPGNSPMKKWR